VEDPNDTCHLAEKKAAARIDEKFTHKPMLKVDAAKYAVEITYPYLEMGKDEYAATLTFNSAMRDWIDYTTSFFRKIEALKELTFIGLYNDQPALKITVTRDQFDSKLASLQEEIAAHAAITFANLGMHRKDDKGAAKEQSTFHGKTYKAALSVLPKEQVSVSPKLK
jgi:hypothetical protein